jgi:hypothetical protein
MDHSEAVELMATERYLLGELTSALREAFEEHFFDCQECAFDVRAEAAFVEGARAELSNLATSSPARTPAEAAKPEPANPRPGRREWFAWWKPAMAIPAFAMLLIVVGYQNLSTIPSLRSAAGSPRLAPWTSLHVGTRAGAHMAVVADHKAGAVLLIDVPNEAGYASFAFELEDPQGKPFWSQTVGAHRDNGEGTLSLLIPGQGLQAGAYTLTISGITAQGSRAQLDRRILDVRFDE